MGGRDSKTKRWAEQKGYELEGEFSAELQELTDAEIQQLQNIDGSILSTDQWSFLSQLSLYSYVSGTVNQIVVTDDGDNTITLSTPQNLDTGAAVQFGSERIGDVDGGDYCEIKADGEINLHGTAKITKKMPLPIITGGGTATVSVITGTPSIDFNADGETAYASFPVPKAWDGISNFTIKAKVQNEIAETDGDDVSFTVTVHSVADGETNADAGQTVSMLLDLTDGDEAINKVNQVSGEIGYADDTYPISTEDSVILKVEINLGGAGECTGPLHIIDWWVEFTANKLGGAI